MTWDALEDLIKGVVQRKLPKTTMTQRAAIAFDIREEMESAFVRDGASYNYQNGDVPGRFVVEEIIAPMNDEEDIEY